MPFLPAVDVKKKRKPHCRSCQTPMEGHKRRDGALVCPQRHPTCSTQSDDDEDFPALRPKIDRTPEKKLKQAATLEREDSFVLPPTDDGPWHWRNPNYVTPDRSRAGSIARSVGKSTLLLDNRGRPIGYSSGRAWVNAEDEDSGEDSGNDRACDSDEIRTLPASHTRSPSKTSSEVFVDLVRAVGTPLATIYDVSARQIPVLREKGREVGIEVGAAPKSPKSLADVSSSDRVRRSKSWWVVLGHDGPMVKRLTARKQMGRVSEPPLPQNYHLWSFWQFFLAVILGGVLAVVGMTLGKGL